MEIYQSKEWGRFMEGIGWEAVSVGNKSSASSCQMLVRKIPFIGSVAKILRPPSPLPYEALEKTARERRALFVKVEPQRSEEEEELKARGFKEDHWPLTPTRAVVIDLKPNLREIARRFHKDARYSIRKSRRNGVTVGKTQLSGDSSKKGVLETFYKLFARTGRKKGFWVPPFRELKEKAKAFGSEAFLLLGHFGEPVSGAFIVFHKKDVYYSHAASTEVGRKLLAQYLVMWEVIKLAKEKGCRNLNLEGVYDPRFAVSRRWKALTIFKKKFGGEILEYPGSYTKYYNPLVKLLFLLNR